MSFSNRLSVIIYLFLIKLLLLTVFFSCTGEAAECGSGKRPLYFAVNSKLEEYLPAGFSSTLSQQLDQPLREIGYCLTRFSTAVERDSLLQDELIMMLSLSFDVTSREVTPVSDELNDDSLDGAPSVTSYVEIDTLIRVIASTISVKDWSLPERRKALANPLVSLAYQPAEVVTFTSVLIKKVVENLRTQYMCHLRIESVPDGVFIRSVHGLEGTTPLEWITPLGKLPITGELEGYEPILRTVDLSTPGNHTYVLQMRNRQFYHSHFFIPAVVSAASSVVSFTAMQYFYNRYHALDGKTKAESPHLFEKNFNYARLCEAGGYAFLGVAVGSFTLSFIF